MKDYSFFVRHTRAAMTVRYEGAFATDEEAVREAFRIFFGAGAGTESSVRVFRNGEPRAYVVLTGDAA